MKMYERSFKSLSDIEVTGRDFACIIMTNTGSIRQPQARLALVNGRMILPNLVETGRAVVVEEGKISAIANPGDLGSDIQVIDAGGRWICPGLIDIHSHGAVRHTFNEPNAEAYAAICEENARHGVTSMLATLVPAPIDDLVRSLHFCRQWMSVQNSGARVIGVHVEGPYVNPEQKGALDPHSLRRPDDGTPEVLLEHHTVIKIMTLAPELPGAPRLIARLDKLGIVPSAGHSSARDTDILIAMENGLRHVTHIWSAMSTTVREGPWRKPGLLEAALTFDGLTVEMISDDRHLPSTLMKLAYKAIGADRLCAISDASSGAGLVEGERFRMGGMEYEVSDGVGMMLDRSSFAGSTTLLNQMIPILTNVVGIPLPRAIRMLALTPAGVVGIQDRIGSLEAGKDADIVLFDDDFSAWRTMIHGEWVYEK
jgi:N-acetylglucosamine-6-phosphate deacetylase